MDNQSLIVALDIGTSKTVMAIAQYNIDTSQFTVIGIGEQLTQGVKKGSIVDLEAVTKCVREVWEKAEQMSGCHIKRAYLSVGGVHVSSMNNRGVVAITNRKREVSLDDVDRVIQAAKVVTLSPEQKIIHVHPRQYIIDGNDGIIDPVGMTGTKLEAEINIITASANELTNLLRSVERTGLTAEDFLPESLTSAEAVLFPAEQELGCLLVDIGGGTTDCAIFDQGRLWFTSALPVGGNLITNDLAIGLRIPVESAEMIKTEYGCVLSKLMAGNEMISVPDMVGQGKKQVSMRLVAEIIEPRIREIITLIKNELHHSGYRGVLPGGVIITGGTAQLKGLVELTAQEMDLPVRIGYPDKINGIGENLGSPAYATVLGLILHGIKNIGFLHNTSNEIGYLSSITDRIKHLFGDFFT